LKPPAYDSSWPSDVKALYKHDTEEIWDPSIAPHIANQYRNQLEIYRRFADGGSKKILDVGCAQGTLALMLAEAGHQVTAVDLRPQFLEYARSRYSHGDIKFLALDVLKNDIPGEYNLVFANQIIEHIVYPVELCRKLFGALSPAGRLVVTTPSWHYVKSHLPSFSELGDVSNWEHLQNTADGDGHFYAYKMQELAQAFIDAGFSEVSVRPFETPAISGHMKVRYAHRFVPYAMLRAAERLALSIPRVRTAFSHQLLCTGIRPG